MTRGLQFGFARIAQEGALEAKIRDKENREHPHVTILRGTKAWRINLRTGEFMDDDPTPAEVPRQLVAFINAASDLAAFAARMGPDVSEQPRLQRRGVGDGC